MKSLEEVGKEALELPAASRILLAEQLLESLNQPDQQRLEKLWTEEIDRRLDRFEKGESRPIPASEVFRKLRNRQR